MQAVGQRRLLTKAEEKVLSEAVQRLIAIEAKQVEVTQRLQRLITEEEWAVDCGYTSINAFREIVNVCA